MIFLLNFTYTINHPGNVDLSSTVVTPPRKERLILLFLISPDPAHLPLVDSAPPLLLEKGQKDPVELISQPNLN